MRESCNGASVCREPTHLELLYIHVIWSRQLSMDSVSEVGPASTKRHLSTFYVDLGSQRNNIMTLKQEMTL